MDPARLSSIPLFAGLPPEEVSRIATFAEEHSEPDGRTLVRQGDFADRISVIDEGTAEVRRDGKVVAALGPGDVFGEIGVLEKTLRNADVVATSPLRLVTLSRFDVKRVPEAAERIRSRAETYPTDGQ